MKINTPCTEQKNLNSIRCFLSLGSNLTNELGTPREHVTHAIQILKENRQITQFTASSLYESEPYGVTDQEDFINAVVSFDTDLSANQLLELCQALETQARRQRVRHWGERSLDVDILLYADAEINQPDLIIPHIELQKRNFVLVPLVEIAPCLNIQGKLITDIALSQDWTGLKLLS